MSYVQDLADQIKDRVPSDKLPDEDAESLFLNYALLALVKGQHVSAEDVHDAWSAWMTQIDPSHESLVPFAELDAATRAEDDVYVQAIRATATSRAE
jgi:hypothetical protein